MGADATLSIAGFVGGEQDIALQTVTPATISSLEIDAPGQGIILSNASGVFDVANVSISPARCSITNGSDALDEASLIQGMAARLASFGATRGFNVAEAGTVTIKLVCDKWGSEPVSISDSNLNATFIPK